MTTIATVKIDGKPYVIVPQKDYDRLIRRGSVPSEKDLPPLPKPDAKGEVPASEFMRATMARRLITDRQAAGLTQQALADLAGIRQETIARIESGKHNVSPQTMDKIDKVLKKLGL